MKDVNHVIVEKNGKLLEIFDSGFSPGPTVVFLHGAGSNASQFREELERLSQDFRVVSISMHGHGAQFKDRKFTPEEFRLDKLADDVILCMDLLHQERFHVVGNSAGGVVGFELVKRFSDRLLSLCTYGTAPKLSFGKLAIRLISGLDRLMISSIPDAYLGLVARNCSKQALVQEKVKILLLESRHAIPYIRSQIGNYDYLDVIRTMKVPYLLMECEFDSEINKTLAEMRQAVQANPCARRVFFEGAGHIANLDQPTMFAELIKAHLNQADEYCKEMKLAV
ncbi:MAG: alpha/beta hydrolase [Anaerolineales bacterium]